MTSVLPPQGLNGGFGGNQTTTTTTTSTSATNIISQAPVGSTTIPMGNNGLYAVYDKPADRRLRPWVILSSAVLAV